MRWARSLAVGLEARTYYALLGHSGRGGGKFGTGVTGQPARLRTYRAAAIDEAFGP
jgi:hypothetical protein